MGPANLAQHHMLPVYSKSLRQQQQQEQELLAHGIQHPSKKEVTRPDSQTLVANNESKTRPYSKRKRASNQKVSHSADKKMRQNNEDIIIPHEEVAHPFNPDLNPNPDTETDDTPWELLSEFPPGTKIRIYKKARPPYMQTRARSRTSPDEESEELHLWNEEADLLKQRIKHPRVKIDNSRSKYGTL